MSRALSRSGVFFLLSRFLLRGLLICLHKEQSEVSKMTKRERSWGEAYLQCGRLQVARLASADLLKSRSLSWLRHPCFEAYRKIARKLLKRHLIVVPWLKLHVNRCSLARATGPFSSTRQLLPGHYDFSEKTSVFFSASCRQRRFVQVTTCWPKANSVNLGHVPWSGTSSKKRITSDICLYQNTYHC